MSLFYKFFRLSDLLSLWPDGNHHAKPRAVVCFLQTQAGMKARLDLVRAYRSSVRGDNTDQGKDLIVLSVPCTYPMLPWATAHGKHRLTRTVQCGDL
jgi:hypothetical protein